MPSWMKVSKPGLSTVKLYLPTWTKSKRYEPSLAVVVVRAIPVAVLVRITLAATTTPPDWSVTVPRREALVWAHAELLRTAMTQKTNAKCSSARRNLTPHLRWTDTCPGHAARGVLGTLQLSKIEGYGFAP